MNISLQQFIKHPIIKNLNPLELRLLLDLYDFAENGIIQDFRITEYVENNKTIEGSITSRTTVTQLLKNLEDKGLIEKRVKRIDIIPLIQ